MHKIIVYIEGGNMQAVWSTDPATEVVLVDMDNIDAGDPSPVSKKDLSTLMECATEGAAVLIKKPEGHFYQVY